jgi:S-DNA-T family DNA segregation ATPase FtsK/SpoIIIE
MPVRFHPKARSAQPIVPNAVGPRISQAYRLPSTALLLPSDGPHPHAVEDLKRLATALTSKCEEFDVHGAVTQINPGPVVTTYEFKPEAGVKYNRITNLVDDLCLALEAESILIERIPGKSTVGIEVPARPSCCGKFWNQTPSTPPVRRSPWRLARKSTDESASLIWLPCRTF